MLNEEIKRKKLDNYYLIEKQKMERRINLEGFPYWLTIDPTNYCNLRCPFCPTGRGKGTRQPAKLGLNLFKRIMDTLGPYLIHIDFCNWGEPFLNENICEMIKLAKTFGINTKIDTNFNVFSEQMAEVLVESGLDEISLSIDGTSQETYEKYRRGGSFEKIMRNIDLLVKVRQKLQKKTPFMRWQFLVFKHNEHEIENARVMAEEKGVDDISFTAPYVGNLEWLTTIDKYRTRHYEIKNGQIGFKKQGNKMICEWLWDAIVVNANGSISACCSVEDEKDDFFPNFPEKNFSEIWNDEKYLTARKKISQGENSFPGSSNVCLRCEHWGWNNHMDVKHILNGLEKH